MPPAAQMLAPAARSYRGAITRPDRWTTWAPRPGDILVCTPPKSGTTWTQTILSMLVHGGPDLPGKLPVLSPWIDADLGVPADEVSAALAAQPGRRVVKTHTPADGFPVWQDVTVIAVYRHPLDVFFSLRSHIANRSGPTGDNPVAWPLPDAIRAFVANGADLRDFDRDCLANLALHHEQTVLSGRLPELRPFHYADMLRNPRHAVAGLAAAAGIDADAALIDAVTQATAFSAMKAKAADYAPVGGTGFWKSDANFFDSASSEKWTGKLTQDDIALYEERLAALIQDTEARSWLEHGDG